MTDKQPEALLYADKLEKVFGLSEYADEIRRLHQSEREAWRYANEVEQERKQLHEVNAELVKSNSELVKTLWRLTELYDAMGAPRGPSRIIAEAALAKAEGK